MKLKKAIACISIISLLLGVLGWPSIHSNAVSLYAFCIGGTTTLISHQNEDDILTFESDDLGMTYEKVKSEWSSTTGNYVDYFFIRFSTAGQHKLIEYCNGKQRLERNVTVNPSHSWNEGYVSKTATYLEPGEKKYTCTFCGEQKTEATPKLEKPTVSTCMGDTTVSINCKQTDTVTFTSDDPAMSYIFAGASSITIGSWGVYSPGYSIYFSTPGFHSLTVYINGTATDVMNFNVFLTHSWSEKILTQPTCLYDGKKN